MKREQALVVVDGVIHRWLERDQLVVFALEMHEGEIVEILKRLDVDLGKRLKLLFRVDAILVGIESLDRHGRVELVERPMMTDAGDLVIGAQHDLGTDRRPDMGMGSHRGRGADDDRVRREQILEVGAPSGPAAARLESLP